MNVSFKENIILSIKEVLEDFSSDYSSEEKRIKESFNKVIDVVVSKIRSVEDMAVCNLRYLKSDILSAHIKTYDQVIKCELKSKFNPKSRFINMNENFKKFYDDIEKICDYMKNLEIQLTEFSNQFYMSIDCVKNTFSLKNPLNDTTVVIDKSGLKFKKISKQYSCIISNRPFKNNCELHIKISKLSDNEWLFLGIINDIGNLSDSNYSLKTSYGFDKYKKRVYKDGVLDKNDSCFDGDIIEGDNLLMKLSTEEGKLKLKNYRTNKKYNISIPKGLEWYFHFNLYRNGDELEIF